MSAVELPFQTQILRTKLHRPAVTDQLVHRDRLTRLMERARETPMTLVSAPAGYGKSVLVSQWLEEQDTPHAWLSLDESDSDRDLFLEYLLAAVRTVFPDACPQTGSLVGLAESAPLAAVSDWLVNELDDIDTPFYLVLDDYHRLCSDSDVHELMERVLAHPPAPLRLVVIARRDPHFPLSSLRARGQLTEVRLQDLRFDREETTGLLASHGEITVSDAALANLHHELEGWAAGLCLTVLALRHVKDAEEFLLELRGGVSQVQEYLVQEVLAAQSPTLRQYLLKSSILDRFCPSLLEAVCSPEDPETPPGLGSGEIVKQLQGGGLFLIGLDAQEEWFRYHQLFQDLLQRQLRRLYAPGDVATLHSRASEWFESEGLITESIRHALAAGDTSRAADIVERHRFGEADKDRFYVVDGWLDMLPPQIKRERLGLLIAQAWVCFFRVAFTQLPSLLERIEAIVDEESVDSVVRGELQYFRGILRFYGGDAEGSLKCFEQASSLLEDSQLNAMSRNEWHLALARYMCGEKALAMQSLEERVRVCDPSKALYLAFLIGAQVFIHLQSGDLAQARVQSQRIQDIAKKGRLANTAAWMTYLLGCYDFHAHDINRAQQQFADAARQGYILHARAGIDALAGLALSQQLSRQADAAAESMDLLQAFATELNEPLFMSVADSCRARTSLMRGEVDAAAEWAWSFDETPAPMALWVWLEVPLITKARVLLAVGTEGSVAAAAELLHSLRQLTETYRFTHHTIETAVLQALALEKQGRTDEALTAMEEAVILGGSRGWVRPFIEPGSESIRLLNRLRERATCAPYVGRILTTAGEAEAGPGGGARVRPGGQPLLDPLTNREREILDLLMKRMSDKEIAERLFIAPQTVNYHCKHIYQKLGVRNRRQAVATAIDLGVVARN